MSQKNSISGDERSTSFDSSDGVKEHSGTDHQDAVSPKITQYRDVNASPEAQEVLAQGAGAGGSLDVNQGVPTRSQRDFYQCEICSLMFSSLNEYLAHKAEHHQQ